jgi:Tfp pilus assembly protein PilF
VANEGQKARDVFQHLLLIDPLEPKYHFGFAMGYQMMGEVKAAARAYLFFLSLDATNPDGYLRLAECFLQVNEPENAREVLEIAIALAGKQPGYEDVPGYARTLLDSIDARQAAGAQA